MPKYDAHEATYVVRDENGQVKSLAPSYVEEEDSIVTAAREYEEATKTKTQSEEEELER